MIYGRGSYPCLRLGKSSCGGSVRFLSSLWQQAWCLSAPRPPRNSNSPAAGKDVGRKVPFPPAVGDFNLAVVSSPAADFLPAVDSSQAADSPPATGSSRAADSPPGNGKAKKAKGVIAARGAAVFLRAVVSPPVEVTNPAASVADLPVASEADLRVPSAAQAHHGMAQPAFRLLQELAPPPP
ncbi:MAG: hypothetical protein KatS3mg106_236 [Gemmataceae bacterium]|jgi:hypothetical protein|nr:MAG: hypothetical protein KatS3mg106_236 [Gemmataceae bacterium]